MSNAAAANTVEERVKNVIAKAYKKNVSEITLETRFIQDLLAKSINLMEQAAMLEEEFGIELTGYQTRGTKTVGQYVTLIKSLLAQ